MSEPLPPMLRIEARPVGENWAFRVHSATTGTQCLIYSRETQLCAAFSQLSQIGITYQEIAACLAIMGTRLPAEAAARFPFIGFTQYGEA